jgi:phytoene desaturase
LLCLGVNRQDAQLRHHTIIMPKDYQKLLRQLFDKDGLPTDLAFFLLTPSKTGPSMAPEGCESLSVTVQVPHLGHGIDWDKESDRFCDRIIGALEHDFGRAGLSGSSLTEHRFTPRDCLREFGSWLGSAFSIEPTLLQFAYFRQHHRSDDVDRLYFVGAGTHPGAGIPSVLLPAEVTSTLANTEHPPLGPSTLFRIEHTGSVDEPHPVRVESVWR